MLRINLLPAYIAERRKIRATIAGFAAGFAATLVLLGAWYATLQTQVTAREQAANEQERLAGEVTQIEQEAQNIRTEVTPILQKKEFVDGVLFYNTLRPKIFRQAAAYTYRNIEYSAMAVEGQTLSIQAFGRNVSDVGRFLITMFGNPDLRAVSVAGVPGWPPQANTSGGAAGGYGGEEGLPAANPGDFAGGGIGAGPEAFAPPSPEGFAGSGFPGSGSEGAYPGGGDPFGGAGMNATTVRRRGFPFTVTGLLVQPVTPPQPPTRTPPPGQGVYPGGGIPGEEGAPPPDAGAPPPSPTAGADPEAPPPDAGP